MINKQTTLSKNEELILKMAIEEYKDTFPRIIEIHQKEFMKIIEKYLEISLAPKNIILPSGSLKKILNIIQYQYYQKEYDKINQSINSIQSTSSCHKFNGTNFYPHCNQNKEPIHSCGRKFFILNNYEYLLCLNCKKIYHPNLILFYCKNCHCNFYSAIENSKEEKNLKPATWVKYHCNVIINDIMKCPICKHILYLNLENHHLLCQNCKFEAKDLQIQWNCIVCQSNFYCEAKIFNPIEYKMLKITLKETIYKAIEAKPNFVPCCNLTKEEIKNYIFTHKKECNGVMYKGELNNKSIVVCVKCHMLNYYEYHNWLCPICKQRFKLKDYYNKRNKSENKIIRLNTNISENKEEFIIKRPVSKKSTNFLNKVFLIEGKNEIKKNIIEKKQSSGNLKYYKDTNSYDTNDESKREEKKETEENENIFSISQKLKSPIKKCMTDDKKSNPKKNKIQFLNLNLTDKNSSSPHKSLNKPNLLSSGIYLSSGINLMNLGENMINQYIQEKDEKEEEEEDKKEKVDKEEVKKEEVEKEEDKEEKVEKEKDKKEEIEKEEDKKEEVNKEEEKKEEVEKKEEKKEEKEDKKEDKEEKVDKEEDKKKEVEKVEDKKEEVDKKEEEEKKEEKKEEDKKEEIKKIKINQFKSDDYNIIRQLGEGTFGKIYLVEGIEKIKYAMKKIFANSEKEVNALQSEYEMLLSLSKYNLNLINIHGLETKRLDKTTFVMYILMDLAICDWEKEIMMRNSKKRFYKESELTAISKELIHTFAELQKHNISHRDIKPQNILLFPDKSFRIADFGEAKELMTNNRATVKQTIRGTELYMSPILFRALQMRNHSKYTEHNTFKSDVFSLGLCILLAATLTFNSIYEIRELNDTHSIKLTLGKYLNKKYSKKFNDFLYSMLEIDEKNRDDFIELDKKVRWL